MGFSVKRVVTRGWPACIFCSAKNESNWPEWPEIASRFIITSPNMIPQKYLEGNILIAQQTGLPKSLRQHLIVDNDIELAKKCVLYLTQQMKKFTENTLSNNSNTVWFPFGQILAELLPSEKGTDNRFTKRLFSFLTIITLARAHLRSILQLGSERLVIANLQNDFSEVLRITQNLSMMPPFKLEFLKQYVIPAYDLKQTSDKSITDEDGKQEEINGVTSREICEYYKKRTGKEISTNCVKQVYLNEFINNGLIDQQDSLLDRRQKVYHPLIGLSDNDNGKHSEQPIERITKSSISNQMDSILQQPKLLMPRNCMDIPENWLNLQILDLLKYSLNPDKFELYNEENERICICKFIKEYEKTHKFNGYFSKPIFRNYHSKVFGDMTYFGRFSNEQYKKLSIEPKMDNLFIPGTGAKTNVIAAAINNTLYSQIVLLKKMKNQGYSNITTFLHDHKYNRQEDENPLQQKFQSEATAKQKEELAKNKLEPFLQAFEELEKEPKVNSALEDADNKKDAVDGRKLKQLLVAKGVFSNVGEAHSFILQMVLSQQLEEVGFETYKRAKDSKNA